MATNIKTVMTYPLDGSTTDFNIPFEYLARKFVQVTLIGVDRKVLVLNQDYRFTTKTIISTTKAWGPGDGYQQIEIRRYTSATERLVDFTDGSILRAYDLNISQIQTLHVAEEARDLTADTIGVNNDGNLDARGRRIVNVGFAVEDGDSVPLAQLRSYDTSALNSARAAKDSEVNAKTSETNSKSYEQLSRKWAVNPEDSAVSGSEFSSYHYSRKSESSATASSNSAASSAASESRARVSEVNAKTSETNSASSAAQADSSKVAAQAAQAAAEVARDEAVAASPAGYAKLANNLGDYPDKAAARSNLSVYSKAEADSKFVPILLSGDEAVAAGWISVDSRWSPAMLSLLRVEVYSNRIVLRGRVTHTGNAVFGLGASGIKWYRILKAPSGQTKWSKAYSPGALNGLVLNGNIVASGATMACYAPSASGTVGTDLMEGTWLADGTVPQTYGVIFCDTYHFLP